MNFAKYALYSIFLAGIIFAYLIWSLPDSRFHIYFLDVGQGDGILIKSPDNRFILIDGGPGSRSQKLVSEIIGNFRRRIDLIILTHPHNDHYAGLIEVVKKNEIGLMILPAPAGKQEPLYTSFLKELLNRGVKTAFFSNKTDIDFGAGIYIDNITPDAAAKMGAMIKSANESSFLLRILYGRLSILITGDAPIEEELAALKTNLELRADILKVGHHGSKTSTSEEFLYSVNPAIAVIQSGKNNRFGHPHAEVLSRLQKFEVEIFRNDLSGTIEFIFGDGS